MPTEDGFLTEAELDAMAARQLGGQPAAKPETAEQREARRQAVADKAHKTADREPDRKVAAKRFSFARTVLMDGLQTGFRHGESRTDSERKRITAGIISALGGENVPDDIQAGVRRLVDKAATSYHDGAPGPAWELADEAAVATANADFDLAPPAEADDPAELAKLIPRG